MTRAEMTQGHSTEFKERKPKSKLADREIYLVVEVPAGKEWRASLIQNKALGSQRDERDITNHNLAGYLSCLEGWSMMQWKTKATQRQCRMDPESKRLPHISGISSWLPPFLLRSGAWTHAELWAAVWSSTQQRALQPKEGFIEPSNGLGWK